MINYRIIDESIRFYQEAGFERVESPWTVTQATLDITKPPGVSSFSIKEKNKSLVASGEQSFLYLYTKGFLPAGKFQTVTPCFRDDSFDSLHTKYFVKNELIVTDDVSLEQLRFVVLKAREFFRKYCLTKRENDSYVLLSTVRDDVHIVDTSNGKMEIVENVDTSSTFLYPQYDLMYRDVELGSYGIRRCDFLTWIYGTGVAEPRLTRTLKKYGIPC